MKFFTLVGVEFRKIRRSRIQILLFLGTVILWLPSVIHADMNFKMQAEGISPENNFFIQGFMGMAAFLFPASMVVCTVLLQQTERNHHGILKMLSLPVCPAKLCFAKFMVLLSLAAAQILMTIGMYGVSAGIASRTQDYNFLLPLSYVFKQAGSILLASIPMLTFFWLLSVWIRTPIFSIGFGLASIVPSVLMINTKVWFVYPMAYPFFVIVSEYGKLATRLSTAPIKWIPWLPVAAGITIICLLLSCFRFGQVERG